MCMCIYFTEHFLTSTLNDDEHKLHRNGLSSEWHFTCLLQCDDLENSLPHIGHLNGPCDNEKEI
jgi:hypothetical protein